MNKIQRYYKKHKEKILYKQKQKRRTIIGRLNRMYEEMVRRSKDISKPYIKIDELPTKDEFIKFALNSKQYVQLYEKWVASGYSWRLTPSVDRIDATKGYSLDNIQFLTRSENIAKGNKEKVRTKAKSVIVVKGSQKMIFPSAKAVAKFFNVSPVTIRVYINKQKLLRGWKINYATY